MCFSPDVEKVNHCNQIYEHDCCKLRHDYLSSAKMKPVTLNEMFQSIVSIWETEKHFQWNALFILHWQKRFHSKWETHSRLHFQWTTLLFFPRNANLLNARGRKSHGFLNLDQDADGNNDGNQVNVAALSLQRRAVQAMKHTQTLCLEGTEERRKNSLSRVSHVPAEHNEPSGGGSATRSDRTTFRRALVYRSRTRTHK